MSQRPVGGRPESWGSTLPRGNFVTSLTTRRRSTKRGQVKVTPRFASVHKKAKLASEQVDANRRGTTALDWRCYSAAAPALRAVLSCGALCDAAGGWSAARAQSSRRRARHGRAALRPLVTVASVSHSAGSSADQRTSIGRQKRPAVSPIADRATTGRTPATLQVHTRTAPAPCSVRRSEAQQQAR